MVPGQYIKQTCLSCSKLSKHKLLGRLGTHHARKPQPVRCVIWWDQHDLKFRTWERGCSCLTIHGQCIFIVNVQFQQPTLVLGVWGWGFPWQSTMISITKPHSAKKHNIPLTKCGPKKLNTTWRHMELRKALRTNCRTLISPKPNDDWCWCCIHLVSLFKSNHRSTCSTLSHRRNTPNNVGSFTHVGVFWYP